MQVEHEKESWSERGREGGTGVEERDCLTNAEDICQNREEEKRGRRRSSNSLFPSHGSSSTHGGGEVQRMN